MEEKLLIKKDVSRLFNELANEYNFFAPVKEKGNIIFKNISNPEEIELEYFNSKIPPKEILFPREETIFTYEYEGKDIKIEEVKAGEKRNIIFGIRPCDAYSYVLLDNFFMSGKFEDDFFSKKKENSILIGIACNTPKQTCFCTSVGGHPFKKDDVDLFLVDLDDKYLIYPINDKGKDLIQKLAWLTEAKESDLKKAEELSKQAESSISTKLNLENISKKLEGNFEHPIWKEISEACLGCGTCTYLCPTCTCFDVIDENEQYVNRGRRIRIWDTCQFCLYTLETSGHNPRDKTFQRCRNRILHKFSYYTINYDLLGCVGCGRCVQLCPVNNDIREILKKINDIEEENIVA
jgi:ferredoxin